MRGFVLKVLVLLGVSAIPLIGTAVVPLRLRSSVEQLVWMSGCWERRSGEVLTEEQWMRPRGGMLLGMSRTVRGDSLLEYEQLRIYEDQGQLVYAPQPSGQAAAEFRSTYVSDSSAVFTNPEHDFPQTIRYHRSGADSLIARIEGPRGDSVHGVDFPMRRVDCL